jgi:hypothetical protein
MTVGTSMVSSGLLESTNSLTIRSDGSLVVSGAAEVNEVLDNKGILEVSSGGTLELLGQVQSDGVISLSGDGEMSIGLLGVVQVGGELTSTESAALQVEGRCVTSVRHSPCSLLFSFFVCEDIDHKLYIFLSEMVSLLVSPRFEPFLKQSTSFN